MTKYSLTKGPTADNTFSISKDLSATEIEVTKQPGAAGGTARLIKNPGAADGKVRITKTAGGTAVAPYVVSSADFNGSTDYIRWNASSPLPESNTYSAVFVLRRDTGNLGTIQVIKDHAANECLFHYETGGSANKIRLFVKDTSNAAIFNVLTTATFTSGSTFVLFVSIDNTINGSEVLRVYADNTNVGPVSPVFASNLPMDLDTGRHTIGASQAATPAAFNHGCMGPLWESTEYIDWAVQANRDNVISAPGVILDPGTDGSNWSPTSTQPEIFIEDTFNASGTNGGSGGNPDVPLSLPSICV